MKINKLMLITNSIEESNKAEYKNALDSLLKHAKSTIVNRVIKTEKYDTLSEDEVIDYVKIINKNAQAANSDISFDEEDSNKITNEFIEVISEVVERKN